MVVGFGWRVTTENRIKKIGVKVEESKSDIEIALLRRFDALTKMRDICKQYLAHERTTLTEVVGLRKGLNPSEEKTVSKNAEQVLSEMNLVVEAYPELQSHKQYQDLQKAVWDIEMQLQSARRIYNRNVSAYNNYMALFPARLVAAALGLKEEPYFEVAEVHKLNDVDMKE